MAIATTLEMKKTLQVNGDLHRHLCDCDTSQDVGIGLNRGICGAASANVENIVIDDSVRFRRRRLVDLWILVKKMAKAQDHRPSHCLQRMDLPADCFALNPNPKAKGRRRRRRRRASGSQKTW